MSRSSASQISTSAMIAAQDSVVQPVQVGLKDSIAGDSASTAALARLTRETRELRNEEGARLLTRAIRAIQKGDFVKGEKLALKALEHDEKLGVAWHALAIAREKMGDFANSMHCYEAALKLLPNHGPAAGDLGRLALRMGMPEIAVKLFIHYLEARPDDLEGVNNLASALRDLNRNEEAIEILRPTIQEHPEQPLLWNTLGTVMCSMGDARTAITFLDETIRLEPTYGKGYHNRAYAKLDLGDVQGALDDGELAIAHTTAPEELATMQFGRSTVLLALGRIQEGWKAYEARFSNDLVEAPRFTITAPRWTPGQALAGKHLMICAEQGLGDEVMFSNLLPDVIEALGPDGKLSLAVERRLIPLFERSFPQADVTAHRTVSFEGRIYRGAPFIEDWSGVDLWAPMGALLETFRPNIASFPIRPSFLVPDPDRVEHWRRVLEDAPKGPKVGVLWKSLKLDGERARQFSPFLLWRPVFETPGVTFVNIQYGDCSEEIAMAREEFGVEIWQPPGIDLKQDLDDVAALCCALDLVVRCFVTQDYKDWRPTMQEVGDAMKAHFTA
ncbi:MAG: tetratricopeptide repeat protein [Caulobacter sp.]|nr:tetratricopeptide repeat protein [Caulobacter sp.]